MVTEISSFIVQAVGLPFLPKKENVKRIWIQAVSVGELSSLAKLLDSLLSDSSMEVVLTGTTSTGLKMAEKNMAKNCSLMALFLWIGYLFHEECGEGLNLISPFLWIVSFGRSIFIRQKSEIFLWSLSMPAFPIVHLPVFPLPGSNGHTHYFFHPIYP